MLTVALTILPNATVMVASLVHAMPVSAQAVEQQ